MNKTPSRRTALSILGLGGASVIAAEDMAHALDNGHDGAQTGYRFGVNPERTAAALRKLADDIEAHGTLPQKLELTSKAGIEDFLEHRLTLEFVVNENDASTRRVG